jgi:class 3 adenylate cyclase
MNYEILPDTYWEEQIQRMQDVLQKIRDRAQSVVTGREVPQDEVLLLGTGRRLPMAVLFVDICGFSSRPSGSAEEQALVVHTFNLFFTEMIRIAEDYGGTVEKNTGDGLMVYFEDGGGDPPEDGCKRAVTAAATMLHATEKAINPVLASSGIAEISFRVGIDHGQVTIAEVGAARRFRSRVAIGSTANVASKMLEVAGPNEIVIGDQVYQRLPREWSQQLAHLHLLQTGWVYVKTGAPYAFYKFTGRWNTRTQSRLNG